MDPSNLVVGEGEGEVAADTGAVADIAADALAFQQRMDLPHTYYSDDFDMLKLNLFPEWMKRYLLVCFDEKVEVEVEVEVDVLHDVHRFVKPYYQMGDLLEKE